MNVQKKMIMIAVSALLIAMVVSGVWYVASTPTNFSSYAPSAR